MGVTTVLVPVDESEAEGLLAGGGSDGLVERTARLRRRVARVDAVREKLHALLFPLWRGGERPVWSVRRWVASLRSPGAAAASTGWDPFVQLFGRSLPVAGSDGRAVAAALVELVDLASDDDFAAQLGEMLSSFDPKAGVVWREAPAFAEDARCEERIAIQRAQISAAMSAGDPARALRPLARLSAWSQPVWRFDGHQLGELLALAGIGIVPEPPSALLEELPGRESAASATTATSPMPARLGAFAGTGGYLTSGAVQLLAGALRLGRSSIAKQVGASGEPPAVAMRHLRLLEEAVLFCETRGLGLWETAGLEWHEED